MAKKFAKKIATYAMAATMIGGAVLVILTSFNFYGKNIYLKFLLDFFTFLVLLDNDKSAPSDYNSCDDQCVTSCSTCHWQ